MDKVIAKDILDKLYSSYGTPATALKYNSAFELLIAVILSAQCTDLRVNKITPALFARFGTAQKMAEANIDELKKLIFSCGFYNAKAASIISASNDIVYKFGGIVPNTVDELMTLKGVGRKTANVVYAVAFGGQAMPVDTHVFRCSHRLGLSRAKTPDKTEEDLIELLDNNNLTLYHHLLITHGRKICHSRKPDCQNCTVMEYCEYYEQNFKKA